MVRNAVGAARQAYVAERGSFHRVQMRLVLAVHGFLQGEGSEAASVIVFEARFASLRADRRITSADILLQLQAASPDNSDQNNDRSLVPEYIEIKDIAPKDDFSIAEQDTPDDSRIRGVLKMNDFGQVEGASWNIIESSQKRNGLPEVIRLAILLTRSSQSKFGMSLQIKAKGSGISFTSSTMSAFNAIAANDPIMFDPTTDPVGLQDYPDQIDSQYLVNVDLKAFVLSFFNKPKFLSRRQVESVEKKDIAERAAIEAKLDDVEGGAPKPESDPPPSPDPGLEPDPLPEGPKGDGIYALMWGQESSGGLHPTITSTIPAGEALVTNLDYFTDIPAKKWRRKLDKALLYDYFPWLNSQEPRDNNMEGDDTVAPVPAACVLLFQRFDKSSLRGFIQLNEMLSDDDVFPVLDVMGLPSEHLDTRKDESGSCYASSRKASSLLNDDPARIIVPDASGPVAYVIQTPVYGDEFWYLLVLTTEAPERTAAVLYADSSIGAADIQKVFHTVHTQAAEYPHHLLLLLELFEDHFKRTGKLFEEVISSINEVDDFLLIQLPKDKNTADKGAAGDASKKTPSQFRSQTLEYATKSYILHLARMNLVRLRRRRDFEKKLAALLEGALISEPQLRTRMQIYNSRASSHETDLEDLPRRIESQSSVITSLVAQQEANLQYGLTLSTVQDSRGMMTLSVITIVFLPGAFIATLFSTNMFNFNDSNEEVAIYFGVVVPLTVILLWAWRLWLKSHSVVFDVESGTVGKSRRQNKQD